MARLKARVEGRVRGSYGKPWSRLSNIPVTPEMLDTIGKCMAKIFAQEAVKDFQKRGWSQKDPGGRAPLSKSFGYKLRGRSTVEITCTFYGVSTLANAGVPEYPMPWLTQQGAGRAVKKKMGASRVSPRKRRPLVVPIKSGGGVIFRTAPLKFKDAWIHPAIAKFTFPQRAARRSKEECLRILRDSVADVLRSGDPTG